MKILDNTKGAMLLDALAAALIIAIVAMVGPIFGTSATSVIQEKQKSIIAANLAASQIEDLKEKAKTQYSADPGPLTAGNHATSLLAADIPAGYTVSYVVTNKVDPVWGEDGNVNNSNYKRVTVTCTYAVTKSLKLVGFMVEQ